MNRKTKVAIVVALFLGVAFCVTDARAAFPAAALQQPPPQTRPAPQTPAQVQTAAPVPPRPADTPADYVIGPDDVLVVLFWREKDLSAEVVVRPDGRITLPLLNDVHAAGLTPDQLRDKVNDLAKRFYEDPNATIVVKQINSRKVFITGQVNKPGAYALNDRMTVLQLIAMAGGLTEFAKSKDIVVMRNDSGGSIRPTGQPITFRFNYREVLDRRNLQQNIQLKPGDTVIVP